MAEGQLISPQYARRGQPTQLAVRETPLQFRHEAELVPPAARPMYSVALQARNALLQEALERQQAKSAELRRILCSLNISVVSLCPRLTLRFFSAEAGLLLGITQGDLGATLSCAAPLDPEGPLMARVRVVLHSGLPEALSVVTASGRRFLCRLLPLQSFQGTCPVNLGVTVTIVANDSGKESVASASQAAHATSPATIRTAGNLQIALDVDGFSAGHTVHRNGLTSRQQQILSQVLAGHPSKNIAADLGISRRTVENHRAAIMQRTGATSLPALARLAIGADISGDCKERTCR